MTQRPTDARLPSGERWHLIEPLLDEALALAPEARHAWLASACGDDVKLRHEVEQLLDACTQPPRRAHDIDRAAATRFASFWDEQPDEGRFIASIAERYMIDGEAGRGGMAIVYRARETHGDRSVALKVLRATASGSSAARFRREIAFASQLTHPGIVGVLDAGACDDRLWYTMPFVEGDTLRDRVRRDGPLALEKAMPVLRDIAEALRYAHERGVVHRDLKPGNVLMAGDRALVADFGIAKAVLASAGADSRIRSEDQIRTATGVGMGTPGYMAPEQWTGERSVDLRADLYSFGVVAYEMLSGQLPFRGDTRQTMLTAQLAGRTERLASRRDVPPILDRLVTRLLAPRAADRPASATEVIAVLVRVQEGLVRSRDASGVQRAVRAIAASPATLHRWWRGVRYGD